MTLLLAAALAACAKFEPPPISHDEPGYEPATLTPEPPAPVEIVEVPTPLPLPAQLKPAPTRPQSTPRAEPRAPAARVVAANAAARVQPVRDGFVNAVQVYPYSPGALYQVYTSPGRITDIALAPGETLVGPGPVAAGDTVRWILGDTTSGTGAQTRVHILVKPTRPDLATNLVINTDRRTYHLELHATPQTWMASVSWSYPEDDLIALRGRTAAAETAAPVEDAFDLARLRFRYEIEGDTPPWRPLRAFDDGTRVFIAFPPGIATGELPPLFVLGAGGAAQLVNYRVRQNHMIVDRLFAAAELRLGDPTRTVRILRSDASE